MKMIRKYIVQGVAALTVALVSLMAACNGTFEKVLPDEEYIDSVNVIYGNPRVLYLIVDGARGVSVRDADAPNLNSLLPHSIYTWVSLSDQEVTGDAANWASLLTGVGKDKHGVTSDDLSTANF